MPTSPSLPLLALSLATLSLLGCTKERVPAVRSDLAATSESSQQPPHAVAATIDGQPITLAQVDEELHAELRELEQKRFDLRREKLETMLLKRLIQAELEKRGISEAEFLKTEITDKVAPPTEEAIQKVFEQNASQLPAGGTLDDYREQLVEFLTRAEEHQRVREVFARLRKEHDVRIHLQAPRTPVESKGPGRGPADARVTIVTFSDFECPYCGRANEVLEKVMQRYAGKVRLVFRHYPLDFHPHAQKAAEASLCASVQGKFWEYHDVLFENQRALEEEHLATYAQQVGLDMKRFGDCLGSGRFESQVAEDKRAGLAAGVSGTPAFFINGIHLSGAQPFEDFERILEDELARTK